MIFNLKHRKFNTKGKLSWEYNPLRNLEVVENDKKALKDFNTSSLTLDINHPVDIECQPSYDGSTNLIFNDDYNVPRIVNTAFSLVENNSYERVSRNQEVKTNIYRDVSLDADTRLQRTTNSFLYFDLKELSEGGELKGGNYVFLAQYADDDDNKTSVVAESGIVCIFNGHYSYPNTFQGTLLHEKTDKQIKFVLKNVDTNFSKIYISYRRSYCDLNGIKQEEFKVIERPFEIESGNAEITITGLENTFDTTQEELSTTRNTYSKVKTHTQNQNVLFFGNVEETYDQIKILQQLSLYIRVQPVWGNSIGYFNQGTFVGNNGLEYYNPHNIYDNLGYMPEEYYRLGVVFVYNDDSKSSVFNLRGCVFNTMGQWNHLDEAPTSDHTIDVNELFIDENSSDFANTKGVFRMPYVDLFATDNVTPIHLKFNIPQYILEELKKLNIKGYYFVRQSRIPIFLSQGFSIGVSDTAHIPVVGANVGSLEDKAICYRIDSPMCRLDGGNTQVETPKKTGSILKLGGYQTQYSNAGNIKTKGLICPDVVLNPQLQSLFSGTVFKVKAVGDYNAINLFKTITDSKKDSEITSKVSTDDRKVDLMRSHKEEEKEFERELIYIPENTPYISYKKNCFSTKAGSSQDIRSIRSVEDQHSFNLNQYCVRGNFMPFVGVCDPKTSSEDSTLEANCVYNIYTSEYSNERDGIEKSIKNRAYNYSEFTSICDTQTLLADELNPTQSIFARGDCFTCTTQHKFTYNFLDTNTPLQTVQVKDKITKGKSKKNQPADVVDQLFDNTVDNIGASAWLEINTSDVNSIDFGYYITAKYISNFNHNIRSVDSQQYEELSLFGSPRKFLPFGGGGYGVSFKIPDSKLHNSGLSTTRTVLQHFEALQVPYVNNHFDNRICFSNISKSNSFSNGFRVFSGLSYQDIERTYGAIVKLLPLGSNLFCVFEHGCGIVPVNEKALISTTTGQSIHMYGAGVLQEQVTVISQDYGSTWEDSIVVTPNGIYGVDTWAKKIWRYNSNGFELISDQLVQRFLNDNVTMNESDWTPTMALKNVKTHYNAYKGDIMFTFYKDDVCWNLCYNERIGKFVTKYTWTPLLSDNIQNSFVTIDRTAVRPLALIAENQVIEKGVRMSDSEAYCFEYVKENEPYAFVFESDDVTTKVVENVCKFNRIFDLVGYEPCDSLMCHIRSVTFSTWDGEKEVIETYTNDTKHGFWIDPHDVEVFAELETEVDEDTVTEEEGTITKSSKYKVSVIGWDKRSSAVESLDGFSLENGEYRIDGDRYYVDSVDNYIDESGKIDGNEENEVEFNNFKAQWKNYVACISGTHLGVEVKLDKYVNWLRIDLSISPMITSFKTVGGLKTHSCSISGNPFMQSISFVANYDCLKKLSDKNNPDNEYNNYLDQYNHTLRVGLYTHGRAGIYDEINYVDDNPDNNIKPTFWYNKQEPFEFEFVVNSPTGMQKVFNNLALISNNAEPESLEVSIIGDAYDFNKSGIFRGANTTIPHDPETGILNTAELIQAKQDAEYKDTDKSQNFNIVFNEGSEKEIRFNTIVSKDNILNQYYLTVHDDCRDVKTWGKRLGNIEYREDKWLVTLSPIMFKNTFATKNESNVVDVKESSLNSTRLRDKWCKIRIKYKGDKLVVISAIQSFTTLSYS